MMKWTMGAAPAEQLDLFRPAPKRPLWGDLPEDVRKMTLELLSQMMEIKVEKAQDGAGEEAKADE